MKVNKAASTPSSWASAENFTGQVRRDALIGAEAPGRVNTGLVTFEPGVTPSMVTASGDSVFFPAGEKHWHGATATTAMTHIAVTESVDGSAVTWMEHVTSDEYDPS